MNECLLDSSLGFDILPQCLYTHLDYNINLAFYMTRLSYHCKCSYTVLCSVLTVCRVVKWSQRFLSFCIFWIVRFASFPHALVFTILFSLFFSRSWLNSITPCHCNGLRRLTAGECCMVAEQVSDAVYTVVGEALHVTNHGSGLDSVLCAHACPRARWSSRVHPFLVLGGRRMGRKRGPLSG